MVGEILELVGTICMIFEPPYKKRTAKENLEWVKEQKFLKNELKGRYEMWKIGWKL